MEGIGTEAKERFSNAESNATVYHEGHFGGLELASGFSGVAETVLQQRFVDAAGMTVGFQHL